MAKGTKTGGRTKGTLNKTTRTVKEAIEHAALGLGGADRLIAWAQEDAANERAFWATIYPKLLPLTLAGDQDNPVSVITKIERHIVHVKH